MLEEAAGEGGIRWSQRAECKLLGDPCVSMVRKLQILFVYKYAPSILVLTSILGSEFSSTIYCSLF